MIKQHHKGGRMQNYYPTPVRYTVSSGEVEDHEWGAQLVGILFVVTGGVLLISPLIKSLGIGTQIFFGIFGIVAFMTGTPSFLEALVIVAVLIPVGVGVVMIYALWQGMPKNKPVGDPEDDTSSAPEPS